MNILKYFKRKIKEPTKLKLRETPFSPNEEQESVIAQRWFDSSMKQRKEMFNKLRPSQKRRLAVVISKYEKDET